MARENFSVLDIVRIVGGILFFNALLSYWFTSSTTWGYHGKYIDWRFWHHTILELELHLSLNELSSYTGEDNGRILLAINGSMYDVTSNRAVYGPKGSYHNLVGKDAARVFVTGCFMKPDEYTYDLRGLDKEECEKDIKGWQRFFETHRDYWYVGNVELTFDFIKEDPPSPCTHMKFPGRS